MSLIRIYFYRKVSQAGESSYAISKEAIEREGSRLILIFRSAAAFFMIVVFVLYIETTGRYVSNRMLRI